MRARLPVGLLIAVLLPGCHGEPRPPAPTAEESRRLDDVEADLNALGNDKGPAPGGTDPSRNSD